MRTTLNIDDGLMKKVRKMAADSRPPDISPARDVRF
jgi:hypothetical protein